MILVDHNERGQAVDGIENANILELIDHHRLGTVETVGPVFFRNQPLGCTATIIFQMYREQGLEIDKTIAGLLTSHTGSIEFLGQRLGGTPAHKIITKGLALVPEGRQIFLQMSVQENLDMGAFSRRGGNIDADMERVFEQFPRLKERRKQVAGTLSGGEQQMLAMGRALMSNPKLLMLDEPSMGLAPLLVEQIFDIIRQLHADGTTILLVEQNAQAALAVADRGYVLETGRIVTEGTGAALLESDAIKKAYLGG